jgi:hypothetical protein
MARKASPVTRLCPCCLGLIKGIHRVERLRTGMLVSPSTPLGTEVSPTVVTVVDPGVNEWHDGVEFLSDEALVVDGSPLGKWFKTKINGLRYANFKTTTSEDMAAAMGLVRLLMR